MPAKREMPKCSDPRSLTRSLRQSARIRTIWVCSAPCSALESRRRSPYNASCVLVMTLYDGPFNHVRNQMRQYSEAQIVGTPFPFLLLNYFILPSSVSYDSKRKSSEQSTCEKHVNHPAQSTVDVHSARVEGERGRGAERGGRTEAERLNLNQAHAKQPHVAR